MKYIAGKVVNNFPVVGRWLLLRASPTLIRPPDVNR